MKNYLITYAILRFHNPPSRNVEAQEGDDIANARHLFLQRFYDDIALPEDCTGVEIVDVEEVKPSLPDYLQTAEDALCHAALQEESDLHLYNAVHALLRHLQAMDAAKGDSEE